MKQKALVAEFVGAFTLLFVGVGSIAANAGNVGIALAHGLAIGVMIGGFGAISGWSPLCLGLQPGDPELNTLAARVVDARC